MDARLKQRVMGAAVLTLLAIVILPMLLDGSPEDRARVLSSIPAPPVIELDKLSFDDIDQRMRDMERESAAQLPVLVPDAPIVSATPSRAKDDAVTAKPEATSSSELALDENLLPVSWSLQLGSFQNPVNADRLRQQLREAEYRSYIIEAKAADGSDTYRVYVGPMLKKSSVEALAREIEAKFDMTGPIVRYSIDDDKGQRGG